jgi:hypothetical protein
MQKKTPDRVTLKSLNWALRHVQSFGDTDLFPVPFEFAAIEFDWGFLQKILQKTDLSDGRARSAMRMMAPKASAGYRAVSQLDPLDTLLLTAALFQASRKIERYRSPRSKRIDCAFRIKPTKEGQWFVSDSGWKDFHDKTEDVLSTGEYSHVVCADIADYYTQASHHRIQNALTAAGVKNARAKHIEFFLNALNSSHHSKGIPVGPSAGILLGEVCLADVDSHLIASHYNHTRYVDDFRIFCRDAASAERALHDLSDYLYKAHRLTLQQGKTRIMTAGEFRREEMFDPEEKEAESKREKLTELVSNFEDAGYDVDEDSIDIAKLNLEVLKDLFEYALQAKPLSVGLARYALRKAAKLDTAVLISSVTENLPQLLPVFRDVIRYLVKATPGKSHARVGRALCDLLRDSRVGFLPFIQLWTVEAFCQQPAFCSQNSAMRFAEKSSPLVRDRLTAQVAGAYRMLHWVRARKEDWSSLGPWHQRALIWSGRILPEDERKHWARSIARSESVDPLSRSVAKLVAT